MPIYEYECASCGGTFEEMQKITAAPLKRCKRCGTGRVRRLISRTSFQLKGSGWYLTDYAQKDGKQASAQGTETTKATADSKTSEKPKNSNTKAASAS